MAKVIYDGRPEDYDYLIESGYDFNMSGYINRGWEIFKQYPGGFIGHMVLTGIIAAMACWIPIAGVGVMLACLAGSYIVSDKIAKGEEYSFSDFFSGFDHFLQLMIAGLLMTVILSIGFVLLIIPGIYLAIAYGMVVPLIVLGKLEAWPAMEVSRKVITKNWWRFLLFGIVVGLIVSLGYIALFIGILVTAPLQYTMMYAVYEDILAHDVEADLVSEIGSQEEDGGQEDLGEEL